MLYRKLCYITLRNRTWSNFHVLFSKWTLKAVIFQQTGLAGSVFNVENRAWFHFQHGSIFNVTPAQHPWGQANEIERKIFLFVILLCQSVNYFYFRSDLKFQAAHPLFGGLWGLGLRCSGSGSGSAEVWKTIYVQELIKR